MEAYHRSAQHSSSAMSVSYPLPSAGAHPRELLTQIAIPPRTLLHARSPSVSPVSSACSVSPLSSTSTVSSTLSSPTPSSPSTAVGLQYPSASAHYYGAQRYNPVSYYAHPYHLHQHAHSLDLHPRAHKTSPLAAPTSPSRAFPVPPLHASLVPVPRPPKRKSEGDGASGLGSLQLSLSPVSPSSARFVFAASPDAAKRMRGMTASPVGRSVVSPRALHAAFPPRPVHSPQRSLPSPPLPLPSPSLSPHSSPSATPTQSPTPRTLLGCPALSPTSGAMSAQSSASVRRRHFLLAPIAIPSPPPSPLCFSSPLSSSSPMFPAPSLSPAPFLALQSRYVVQRTLQQSLFSSTKAAATLPPLAPRLVCVKVARHASGAHLQREAEVLQWVHREGKVSGVEEFVEHCVDDEYEYLVTGLGAKGDLWSVLEGEKAGKLSAARVQEVFAMTVDAVRRLHDERRVAHLDLSLENLVEEEDGSVSIVDFGSAVVHSSVAPSPALVHPLVASSSEKEARYACAAYPLTSPLPCKAVYASPELTGHSAFDAFACDVFALGVLLYTLVTGHPPFERAVDSDPWYRAISTGSWLHDDVISQSAAAVYAGVDEAVLQLIGRMIRPENDRCSLAEVHAHPWVQEGRARRAGRKAGHAGEVSVAEAQTV